MNSINNKFFLISVLFFLQVPLFADHQHDLEVWLQKMHSAAHSQNYIGTFVYQQDQQLSMMKIIHSVKDGGERERLISLDGSGREVIRDHERVTCILPDVKSVVVEKTRPDANFPPVFPMSMSKLDKHYTLKLGKQEKIASHMAQVIIIKPNDPYRYGHHLWVDVDTGLLLQSQILDEDGVVLEQFKFTEISYMKDIPENMLLSDVVDASFTWYEEDSKQKETTVFKWEIVNLPDGFMHDMERNHNMPDNGMPVEHHVFTDGLASVSVFVEEIEADASQFMGAASMGSVNAYGRVVDNYQVTVVGVVPIKTVKMICDSVVHNK